LNTANLDLALLRTLIRDERDVQMQGLLTSAPGEKSEVSEEKAAVQLNAEKLKFIDEISRLILELKSQFPELAQSLSKVRDYVSATQENIPVKKLTNMLNAIQQNLNSLTDKSAEIIKSITGEIMKFLPKNTEIPQENKLIIALAKNDLITANMVIKNIVESYALANMPTNTPANIQTNTPANMQINIPANIQINTPANIPINAPINIPINVPALQIIFNAIQELKELGIPREFQNAPLKELEAITIQKTGIEVPKDMARTLSAAFSEKPIFTTVNFKPEVLSINYPVPVSAPISITAPISDIVPKSNYIPISTHAPISTHVPISTHIPISVPTSDIVPKSNIVPVSISDPISDIVSKSAHASITVRIENIEIPLPKDHPLEKFFPTTTSTIAFSLYQLTAPQPQVHNPQPPVSIPKSSVPAPLPPESRSQFFLQPWPASVQIPKEERDFWLKTELPLTPQTLNIRETILSFGKLPENPEPVRLFTGAMHELSLQTENGKPVTKEQANLLWRVINSLPPTQNSQLTQIISSSFLKYQSIGNHEGDLFKNLPEPVKKELLRELPAGKAWQPEVLQKAVEKILDKYIEQHPSTANEHAKKTNEDVRQVLQNFKEQIQWTRIDQDTRPPTDRENVFYFMHEGDLQKGRLKIKDQRKGGKKQQDSSISFTIETKTKNLGNVHADLTLSKNILNIHLQDEIGTANEAVAQEREALAKELADIGITLGELLYGKTPKIQTIPIAEKKEKTGMLDVKA